MFLNCSIQFNDINNDFVQNPLFDFDNLTSYQNIILNSNTDFEDARNNFFFPLISSEILDLGDLETALSAPIDILGNSRVMTPDLGAYEFITPQ